MTQINASVRNTCDTVVERIRVSVVPTELPEFLPDARRLVALALYHRTRADRSGCQAEQREHHRIADIYEVLATIDLPISALAEIAGRQ
ncbi:MAG TPA: hypothetical protein VHX39_33435 [Acetobacteraceae bacterium]|nr:hypothetical protein [Acetobacteraceae bacterium]